MRNAYRTTSGEHVETLEGAFGAPLFQRHARGYALTDAGRDMLEFLAGAQLARLEHGEAHGAIRAGAKPEMSSRALMPDYLRLVALIGIVVVNVQFVAFSALGSFADPGGDTTLDAITLWLVNGLALFKTYGLFSFMFGVGLGFLMRSVARRGLSFGRVYRNRTAIRAGRQIIIQKLS
jgi:DNA-binding transcriptional LysR family regulator